MKPKRKFVALPEPTHADLKATAKANCRTIAGQINHWLKTQPICSKGA